MKRILIVVAVVVVALVIFGTGFAFAQFQSVSAAGYGPGMMGNWYAQNGTPVPGQGYGPGMMGGRGGRGGNGGYGVMESYVEQALADKLDLTVAQVQEQLAAGKTMTQVALDNGIAQADLQTVFDEVHKTAFDQAVAAGVLTQAQADLMLQNMQGRWNVSGQGYGPGMMGGRGGRGGNGGYGVMQNYVEQALADKLGLTEAQVEEQLAAGKTMAQVALDHGIAQADLPTVFAEIHKTAFDKAVAAGVMTQAQADTMLQNMQNNWDDMPCLDGDQPGQGYGPGGMMGGRGGRGGGRWNQAPQTNP